MGFASCDLLDARLTRVRGIMADEGLDALVISHLPNIFYLTNLAASAAIVALTRDRILLITDFRYISAAESLLAAGTSPSIVELVRVDRSYDESLADVLRTLGRMSVGVEGAHFTLIRYQRLAAALGAHETGAATDAVTLVPTERVVERVRIRKDACEIATLREAGRRLSDVARRTLAGLCAGSTEREVAAGIDLALRRAGFDKTAFETIVASGPNSSLPHARPGTRQIGRPDLVVLDFGGVYDGYCVDLTRTICLGEPRAEHVRMFQAVSLANAAARTAVRPGVTAGSIDKAARDTVDSFGFADAFGHATGHGLGLEVHEEPRIAQPKSSVSRLTTDVTEDEVIETGMVFTIEPGVYLPGVGGIRLEDDVLVTETGCEVLTDVPMELTPRQ